MTFEAYLRRYKSIFEKDFEKMSGREKSKTFTKQIQGGRTWKRRKFYSAEAVTFQETIQILTKILEDQSSVFNTRCQRLNLTKNDCDDDTTFACTVNRYSERFQQNKITPDMFKFLIFIQVLTSLSEKVRKRLLFKLEPDQKITLQRLTCVFWIWELIQQKLKNRVFQIFIQ